MAKFGESFYFRNGLFLFSLLLIGAGVGSVADAQDTPPATSVGFTKSPELAPRMFRGNAGGSRGRRTAGPTGRISTTYRRGGSTGASRTCS